MTLRKIRIGIAWMIMGFFLLIFIGGEHVSSAFSRYLLFFQFTPSFVKFLLAAEGMVSVGFLLILLVTLLFGRIYCACLCPLGILQDVMSFIARKGKKKKAPQTFLPLRPVLRYGIFGLTVVSSLLGTLALLNLLDPYSIFGRIANHLFKPAALFLNNLLVSGLELFDIYALTTLAFHHIPLRILMISLGAFSFLVILASIRGRLYCNTICPVGTLLGFVSRFSFFKISFQKDSCISCGVCENACRAGCINSQEKHVDSNRCVLCFVCLAVCPKSSLSYSSGVNRSSQHEIDSSRRKILLGSTSAFGALVLLSFPGRSLLKQVLGKYTATPVSPPGSLSIRHFTETCTACHLCVSVCPSKVLRPAFLEYGLQGMMQPELDYNRGSCAYECHVCGYVCPTGAIIPLPLEEKQLTQIGKAKLVKEDCLVHAKDQECGACVEVCPTHAVYTEGKNGILYPKMNVDHCIGCGYCQFVCPQNPKAIFVEANHIHAIAKAPFYVQDEPAPESPDPHADSEEDFPF